VFCLAVTADGRGQAGNIRRDVAQRL
jgi:hypothetical protein